MWLTSTTEGKGRRGGAARKQGARVNKEEREGNCDSDTEGTVALQGVWGGGGGGGVPNVP